MSKLLVTALALIVVTLGGCANMPSDVIGTAATSADGPFGRDYLPVAPQTPWYSE